MNIGNILAAWDSSFPLSYSQGIFWGIERSIIERQ